MSKRRRAPRLCASLFALLTAACGGTNTPAGPVVGFGGGGGTPPTKLVSVKVTVTVPAPPKQRVRPDYLSYDTESLSIVLSSVDGKGVTGVNTTVMNTLPKSHDCKPGAGGIVCTATAQGSPGGDVFAVSTYSQTDANGLVLSVGTVEAKISGGGGVGISNRVPLTLEGVIASLKLSVTPNKAKRGDAVEATVALDAYDASGAEIVGPSYYFEPISVTIEGNTNNAFRLHYGPHSGDSLTIKKPATGITLTYDGNKQASPITLQATVGGTASISKNAAFALIGRRPPPPIGTIYVLNLGSGDGVGATVTEYDGKAKGNAAPERTLTLSSSLYARSIAVDAAGDLYVGYFDNEEGFSPESGEPDPANEIAVYAPGASGDDQPKAVIAENKATSTTIFPIFMAFDTQDRLVTYGATSVDGNTGDAVLTFAPDATGTPAPDYGWDFDTPYLRYSGPTGLALDAQDNFFVNGALHTNEGSAYGMYENSAANVGNPSATPVRTIPWNASSGLNPGLTTNVAVGTNGEVFIAYATSSGSGSTSVCQANVNVYASGTNGGVKPIRVMTLSGLSAKDCANSHGPFIEFYPTIALYGTDVFVVDDYANVVDAFPANAHGTVKPTLQIAGSATELDAPIAVVVTSTK